MYPYNPHLPLHYLNHAMHPSEFLNSTSENLEEARQNSFLTNRFEDELAEMIWDNGQISTQELSKFPDSHTSITPNSHNICDYSRVGNITIDPPADLGDSVTVEAVLNEYVSSAMISSGLMDSSSAHRSLNHPTYIGFPHEDVCSEPLLLPGSSSFSCHISDYPSDVINHAMPLARDSNFVANDDFAREVTEKVNLYSAPLVPHSLSNFSHFERPLTQSKADNNSSDHHEQVMGFESLRYVSEKSDLHGEIEKSKKRAEISSSFGDVNEEITCKQRLYVENESNVRKKKGTFQAKGITGSKRRRATEASEVRNLSEKRRRALINEKIRALQQLVPNSRKADKASMLDEAIKYIQALQFQIQIMSRIQSFMQSGAAAHVRQYFPSFQVPCRDFFYGHEPHHRLHNVSSSFPRTVQTINNNIPPHVTNCAVSSNASTSGRIKPIEALVTLPHGEGSSSCSVTCKNSNKVQDSDDNNNNSNQGTDARKL